jgi:hypothetical protein
LTADKPATEPAASATNAPAATDPDASIAPEFKAGTGDATNASPDLSGLTREQLEARVKTLTDSLAAANSESEYFREQWTELRLRDEALGVEALTVDESHTEERVVEAVRELYHSEMKRREALVLLNKLMATTDKLLQTAPNYDPKVRAEYEEASRGAKAYLAGGDAAAIPLATSLADGRVADSNPELNAVILNLGKNLGVKEGMRFVIYQDNVEVGTVKIVLARDEISAAQIEDLKPNTVLKIGDRAAVEAAPSEDSR